MVTAPESTANNVTETVTETVHVNETVDETVSETPPPRPLSHTNTVSTEHQNNSALDTDQLQNNQHTDQQNNDQANNQITEQNTQQVNQQVNQQNNEESPAGGPEHDDTLTPPTPANRPGETTAGSPVLRSGSMT